MPGDAAAPARPSLIGAALCSAPGPDPAAPCSRPDGACAGPRDDPGCVIRRALQAGADLPAAAEHYLLLWLLRLANERDPAEAAEALLSAYCPAAAAGDGRAGAIVGLLRQTAAFPRPRLRAHARVRRRPRPPVASS